MPERRDEEAPAAAARDLRKDPLGRELLEQKRGASDLSCGLVQTDSPALGRGALRLSAGVGLNDGSGATSTAIAGGN
jgi:hypothetical protein